MTTASKGRWWSRRGHAVVLSQVRAFGVEVLVGRGVPRRRAEFAVDALLAKDLQGDHLRGMGELGRYIAAIDDGSIDPRARLRIVHDGGGAVVVEAERGLLFSTGLDAIRLGIRRAREHGTSFVGVRAQLGRLEPYLAYASERGIVALGTILSPPLLGATPRARARAGNNPLGLAASAPERTLLLDAAMSLSSAYPIRVRATRGEPLPAALVYDGRGRATTDARAFREGPDGAATRGALVPIGGYKGYALAAALGVLSGPLVAAPPRGDQGAAPPAAGTALICIDPARLGGRKSFTRRLDGYLDWLSGTPGGRYPGQVSRRAIAAGRSTDQVRLDATTIASLRALAKHVGVTAPV